MIKIEKETLLIIQNTVRNLAVALESDNSNAQIELIAIAVLNKLFMSTHGISDIEHTRASMIADAIVEAKLTCGCAQCRSHLDSVKH